MAQNGQHDKEPYVPQFYIAYNGNLEKMFPSPVFVNMTRGIVGTCQRGFLFLSTGWHVALNVAGLHFRELIKWVMVTVAVFI